MIEKKIADRYVRWAILVAQNSVPNDHPWHKWANDWLSGRDRTGVATVSAWAATVSAWGPAWGAVRVAAWTARVAAEGASWGTARGTAWAASAAARAASAAALEAAALEAAAGEVDRICQLARECGLPLTTAKWRGRGLMPELPSGGVLLWKAVNVEGKGRLGYPYKVGRPFACTGMACPGPAGACKEHERIPNKYLMALDVSDAFDYEPENGVYLAYRGMPLAMYRAERAGDEWEFRLLDGEDQLWRIGA